MFPLSDRFFILREREREREQGDIRGAFRTQPPENASHRAVFSGCELARRVRVYVSRVRVLQNRALH